jgi:hypothetical protein
MVALLGRHKALALPRIIEKVRNIFTTQRRGRDLASVILW